MKTFHFSRFFAATAALVLTAGGVTAAEKANPYDQLSATLAPLMEIFSPQGKMRALSATLVLESMTGLAPELIGGRVELLLEPPSRAAIRVNYGGREAELVRSGQSLWVAPLALYEAFPVQPPSRKKKKKKKEAEGLDPLLLPFPPQQLALLPVLFIVKEGGRDAEGLRVLEAKLMPELAQAISRRHPDARAQDWTARLSLREGKLARIELSRPDWAVAVRIEALELSGRLPPTNWVPSAGDTTKLEGPEARRWLNAVGRVINRQADKLRGGDQ